MTQVSVVDSQRQKVYDAENAIKHLSSQFETERGVIAYAKHIAMRAPIKRRYQRELLGWHLGKQEIAFNVTFTPRLVRTAHANYSGINLGYSKNWSWHSWVVLHEMSHVIICRRHRRDDVAAHGREFCAVYLDLVRFTLGREAYEALKESFRKHRVKFTKKRNVVFSEEQKDAMRVRMMLARQKLPTREKSAPYSKKVFCERCGDLMTINYSEAARICRECKTPRIVIDFPEDE